MQHDVMISFSSKNRPIVEKIRRRIEEAGLRCWVSYRDIKPGESYMGAIAAAIKASHAIVFVMCSNFNISRETKNEMSLASKYGKAMIPVRTESFDFSDDLEYWVATIQHLDAFPDFDDAVSRIISRIKEVLPVQSPRLHKDTARTTPDHGSPVNIGNEANPDFGVPLSQLEESLAGSGPSEQRDNRRRSTPSSSQSSYWFFNVGDGPRRVWEDNRKFGFMSAGTEARFRVATQRLNPGNLIFAYLKGHGYVGFGEVTNSAVMIRDFYTPDGKPLLSCELTRPKLMAEYSENYDRSEWAVAIKWKKTLPREAAVRFPRMFAPQHAVCRLTDEKSLEVLLAAFN